MKRNALPAGYLEFPQSSGSMIAGHLMAGGEMVTIEDNVSSQQTVMMALSSRIRSCWTDADCLLVN